MRALDVIHHIESERQRIAGLQHYIRELEQLQETLRGMSMRDPLTGLYNRRFLSEEGERLLRYAQREGTGLCAAMVDVDGFKQINDELGHPVGDLVLVELAALMTQTLRGTDLIARYGGEEIALLLPSTRCRDAYHTCERLRLAVEQYNWSGVHPKLRVTVSIGLAENDGGALDELLACADAQLYVSKRAGRNRTSYSQEARERQG